MVEAARAEYNNVVNKISVYQNSIGKPVLYYHEFNPCYWRGKPGKTYNLEKATIGDMAEFKKRYGSLLREIAGELGLRDEALLAAFIFNKTSGVGFDTGRIQVRFEIHKFHQYVDEPNILSR